MCEKIMKFGMILIVCISFQSLALCAEFAGGTGEPNDPYQIATGEQLISIGSDPNLMDKHFTLVNDIDLDPNLPGGSIFTDAVIARDESDGVSGHTGFPFRGILDGQGHTIANLHIEGKYGYDAGLIGNLSGLVKDLHFTDVVVSGSPCGAIAGLNQQGVILRCTATGQVSGLEDIGGLVGANWEGSLVECKAEVQVTGGDNAGGMVGGGPGGTLIHCEVRADVSGENNIGGLAGKSHQGQIMECKTTGIVVGNNNVGGLIGASDRTIVWWSSSKCEVTAEETAGGLTGSTVWSSGPVLVNCYAQGSVTGSTIGGIAGEARHNQVINCYSACELIGLEFEGREPFVGGLIGDSMVSAWAPLTIGCFWDAELSGVDVGVGPDQLELGTGLTTEQMLDKESFVNAGWDFGHTWIMPDGDYPILQWEKAGN